MFLESVGGMDRFVSSRRVASGVFKNDGRTTGMSLLYVREIRESEVKKGE